MKRIAWPKTNEGFTLVEMMIVLTIIIALVGMSLGPAARLIRWQKEMATQQTLDSLNAAIGNIYVANAWTVDSSDAATFNFSFNNAPYALTPGLANIPANLAALQAIASIASMSSSAIDMDSMHNEMYVFVSNLLNDATSTVSYHTVAIVSPGWNGTLESTFDPATGILNLAGDDKGFVLSGWQYEMNNVQSTMTKMGIVRDAYQNYFTSQYMLDPAKNVYVDHFANEDKNCGNASGYWDSSSTVLNSGCEAVSRATDIGLKAALGLSKDAITTAWGREMLIDNDSAAVKSPDGSGGLSVPYTATINAELPWGAASLLTVTATGLY